MSIKTIPKHTDDRKSLASEIRSTRNLIRTSNNPAIKEAVGKWLRVLRGNAKGMRRSE